MLASSFMTAEALGITEPERLALIEFHRRAAAGEISEDKFDMLAVGRPECRTPACIMGWCMAIDSAAGARLWARYVASCRGTYDAAPILRLFSWAAPHRTVAAAGEATYRYLTMGHI